MLRLSPGAHCWLLQRYHWSYRASYRAEQVWGTNLKMPWGTDMIPVHLSSWLASRCPPAQGQEGEVSKRQQGSSSNPNRWPTIWFIISLMILLTLYHPNANSRLPWKDTRKAHPTFCLFPEHWRKNNDKKEETKRKKHTLQPWLATHLFNLLSAASGP